MLQLSRRISCAIESIISVNRMFASVCVLPLALILSGCGSDTTASTRPKYSTPSSKPLPEEYRVLASHLSMEMKSNPGQFRDNREIAEIMADVQSALLDLREIKSNDREIMYLSDQVQDANTLILQCINNLNALPKPPDEGTLFVGSMLDGFFGNFEGSYNRSLDAEAKQNAINVEFQSAIAAADKMDAALQLLPKVAEKYSATFCDSTGRVVVDFNENWGDSGSKDWLVLQNRGETLKDCTILVQLTGASGEVRKNVHFLKTWPSYIGRWGRYQSGVKVLGRTVERTTVKNVQELDITIYSPQFATQIHYVYQGAEKDKDIAHICKDLSFQGAYQPHESGIIWDTQRGAQFTMNGVSFLPKCRVDVTFRKANQSKGWFWNLDSWNKGETKSFNTPKGGLSFDPDKVDFEVSFPDTNYKYKTTLTVDLKSGK
tara:strand:- start:344 stop:1639 length:1296 start_codon:yes stop_codon:yes gene_type:complete